MSKLTLRKAATSDLVFLDQIREEKLPKMHQSRFDEQKEGLGDYLLAFKDEEPVGHVYIKYKDEYDYHDCPMLHDLFVKQNKRKQGIATNILEEAKKYLRTKNYNEAGIDVGIEDEWIKDFYEKCGFKFISGPHKYSFIEKDSGKKIIDDIYHLRAKLLN